jgi:hypothetical protein
VKGVGQARRQCRAHRGQQAGVGEGGGGVGVRPACWGSGCRDWSDGVRARGRSARVHNADPRGGRGRHGVAEEFGPPVVTLAGRRHPVVAQDHTAARHVPRRIRRVVLQDCRRFAHL